jgi:hypothetical protein
MKIQTNAGEVELTAEMVCRGMVFAPKDPSDYCLAEGRIFVVGRRDDANGVWRDARDENLGTNVIGAGADGLLGCDPTVASRAACERFGVHGDAAAHGFARLRDGGAVDLRRTLPRGATYRTESGTRFLRKDGGGDGMLPDCIFVGLAARHASPEDVRHMCCGERWHEADGIRTCTLAIGDHDEHEDIAHGVKWAAKQGCAAECSSCGCRGRCPWSGPLKKSDEDAVACESCGCEWCGPRRCDDRHRSSLGDARCNLPACHTLEAHRDVMGETWENFDQSPATGKRASVTAGCPCDALGRGAPGLHTKDCKAGRALKWEMGTASLGQSQAHVVRDGDVYRWQVNHLGLRIRDGVEPHTFDAHEAAGRILFAVHDATAGIEWLARMFGLLFAVHNATPAAKRAKQEAPLVALVAAVPEGLDPIGWRAAVLAVDEAHPESDREMRLRADKRISDPSGQWLVANVNRPCDLPGWSVNRIMHDAYHRAVAPGPIKADSERKQRTSSIRLPDDDDFGW